MAHNQPIITNVEELGSPVDKLRVTFTHDGSADTLEGFNIFHDDESGTTTPTWVDAADAQCVGMGDGGSPTTYQVLVPVPLADAATWWETFGEYATGTAGTLDKGGSAWGSAAVMAETGT